jgi:outer membrane immunogenic protein
MGILDKFYVPRMSLPVYFASARGLLMRRHSLAIIAAVSTIALTQIALAADLPRKAPAYAPPPPPPVYNWTGFYLGANIGGGWGSRDVDYSPNDAAAVGLFSPATPSLFPAYDGNQGGAPPPTSLHSSGLLGGLQLGYNWQFHRNWLIGVEADFNWSDMDDSASSGGVAIQGAVGIPFTNTVDERIKWFGTVRARLGYLPTDNLLAYVTGGFAYGKVEHSGSYVNNDTTFSLFGVSSDFFSFSCAPGRTCFAGSSSHTATGWTVGGGLEYALWRNVTVKAEYIYVSLDRDSVTETALVVDDPQSDKPASFNANFSRTNINVVRVGLNYRF